MEPPPGFYTTLEVARLARIKERTLYDWQRRGIAAPSVRIKLDEKYEYGYSYADLTLLRLIRALREDQIDFQSALSALRHLQNRLGPPTNGWADANVYFVGNKIYAEKPDGWPVTSATQGGQTIAEELFGDLIDDLRNLEDEWSIVIPQQFRPFVLINPSIMGGDPVIRDTRIPTATVAQMVRNGLAIAEIDEYYDHVDPMRIEKAIAYEEYLDLEAAAT